MTAGDYYSTAQCWLELHPQDGCREGPMLAAVAPVGCDWGLSCGLCLYRWSGYSQGLTAELSLYVFSSLPTTRSKEPIPLNTWISVLLERSGRKGVMRINNGERVMGESPVR